MANMYPTSPGSGLPLDLRGIPDFPGSFPVGPWDPGYPSPKILPPPGDPFGPWGKRIRRKALRSLGPIGLGLAMMDFLMPTRGPYPRIPPGWVKVNDCGGNPDTIYAEAHTATCPGSGLFDDAHPEPDLSTLTQFGLWGPKRRFPSPNEHIFLAQFCEAWQKVEDPGPDWPFEPKYMPAIRMPVAPIFWPFTPDELPIAQPMPEMKPIPFVEVPARVGQGFPQEFQRGYALPTYNQQRPYVPPLTDFVGDPDENEGRIVPVPHPSGPVGPGRPGTPGVVIPVPPGPGEKEKKIRMHSAGVIALRFVNIVSEAVDFMDALYWALPKKYTSSRHNGSQRAQILYQHLDEVDWNKALQNVAINEFQDRILGAAGKRIGELSRKLGRPVGLQAGPAI